MMPFLHIQRYYRERALYSIDTIERGLSIVRAARAIRMRVVRVRVVRVYPVRVRLVLSLSLSFALPFLPD